MNSLAMKIILASFLVSSTAFAAAGSVTITTPKDGAMVNSTDKIKLTFEAVPGPDGDHLHLNVDGKRVEVIHQLKGTAEAGPLAAGNHRICLTVNTKAHIPTDVEGCINVTSK